MRERCYECFRPMSSCFCETIPRIDNRTNILILQHVGERSHPFNTARIVRKALRHCNLITGHNRELAAHELPIEESAGLLYPGTDAAALTDLPVAERPGQLVIIDGTWHQAKTIFRDVSQLQDLPCYRLSPASPGQYRIRLEPDAHSLSTLEATVAALQVLEPETTGLDQLLSAFHEMVENQLGHATGGAAWRKRNRPSRPRFLPHILLQEPDRLVVAYGEATPGQPGQRSQVSSPVNWVARRLDSGESFSCLLTPQPPLSPAALEHMRLSESDFVDAVTPNEFCRRWGQFVRPDDVLIVYHQNTYRLLKHVDAVQPRCLVLKSIFRKWQTGVRSLEQLVSVEGLRLPALDDKCRANQRLDLAVALVEHLRTHYGQLHR